MYSLKHLKRFPMTLALIAGVLWNILCFFNIMPIENFKFSFAILSVGLIFSFAQFFIDRKSSSRSAKEKRRDMRILKNQRSCIGFGMCVFALYALTVIFCGIFG